MKIYVFCVIYIYVLFMICRDSPPRSYQNVDDQAVVSRRSSKSSVISVSSNCLAQAESYSRVEDRTDRDSIISSPARLDTEIG